MSWIYSPAMVYDYYYLSPLCESIASRLVVCFGVGNTGYEDINLILEALLLSRRDGVWDGIRDGTDFGME